MFANSEYSIREIRTLLGAGIAMAAIRRLAGEVRAAYRRSRQRARLRRDLLHLDARQLRDIGLARTDLEAEAAKPFWRR
ncbi:MAG: DUF1127 domain-containing protein [Halofilum sp. (in: g-proteobacteria)]|nr:DUF1127 domain-containing protein [Halofilum sp. (in: g-proteobacteria)]